MMIILLERYQNVGKIRWNFFDNNLDTSVKDFLPIYVKFAL